MNNERKRYNRKNRRKFSLKAHFVLVTKYRRMVFRNEINNKLKQLCSEIAEKKKWRILAIESDFDHLHILLSYDVNNSVEKIVSLLKQYTTYYLWKDYEYILRKYYWKERKLWSDGYFVCSIGEVSEETIKKYIEMQG